MKLFILQTTIPDYRGKFFAELKKLVYDKFELISILVIWIELFSKRNN